MYLCLWMAPCPHRLNPGSSSCSQREKIRPTVHGKLNGRANLGAGPRTGVHMRGPCRRLGLTPLWLTLSHTD